MSKFNIEENIQKTLKLIGYIPRSEATDETYNNLGFMSGLEVHQQLATDEKLFCRCPAGMYQDLNKSDAEVIRHMRPTLSELGEYDGTALMEFRTRKNITYRIHNETTCTYDIDDTPPFPMNRQALKFALIISLLLKLKIVGELHIIRKQYLDGSIPAGFQRTGIIGIDGGIPVNGRNIRIMQLSIEEDSCREVSDIGHERIYSTDRLGTPLIEVVTQPDPKTPDELTETAQYIRFLNRSTGLVNTGMGASRQDVNVSIAGGTRVEIKGVAHIKWIPELTHNEAFRQKSLLTIKDLLNKKMAKTEFKVNHTEIDINSIKSEHDLIKNAKENNFVLTAINLPEFEGILSFFTQPNQTFINEISDRLKVIAGIEKPNHTHSEDIENVLTNTDWNMIQEKLKSKKNDAQILVLGLKSDMKTAIESIEERCQLAFEGVPNETRKSLPDGTTLFERVLPGPDRMYPDTDSAPIKIENELVEKTKIGLPISIEDRIAQLNKWNAPADTFHYILKNNLSPILEKIVNDFDINGKRVCTIFGHTLKHIEGQQPRHVEFSYERIYELLKFITTKNITLDLIPKMLEVIYQYPLMDFESILTTIEFKTIEKDEIVSKIEPLKSIYKNVGRVQTTQNETNWMMGELRPTAIGNMPLSELKSYIENGGK
jgi:glutamyl-tRNA(Gln) amidotransferase subunit E